MNGINPNGEQPTRASIRETQGENAFSAPDPAPAVPAKDETLPDKSIPSGLLVIVLLVGTILLTLLLPIGSAIPAVLAFAALSFGIYAFWVTAMGNPSSGESFMAAMLCVAILGTVTYFASGMLGIGANVGPHASSQACKLYYSTLEANAKGNLSQSDYVEQMLEVEKLTQKSDDQGIKAAGMSSALHKACTQAGH